MQILIVKTSSLGDVIHTLPAVTDAKQRYPDLQFDWVVEEAFAEIPTWHPAIRHVIPVALRRWRKQILTTYLNGTWHQFKQTLNSNKYDKIIDAQGLIKSSFLSYQASGTRCGLDYNSAREPLASVAYQKRYNIFKNQHAVTRVRQLFANVLDYKLPNTPPEYGIKNHFSQQLNNKQIVFLHGTTWLTKHWPEDNWFKLAKLVTDVGLNIKVPWGNSDEQQRALRIAAVHKNISLIPKGSLHDLAIILAQSQAVVGVDTGLAHLAAALSIPSITLYGATQPAKTGTYGDNQQHLLANVPCSPCLNKKCSANLICYNDLSVKKVWEALEKLLSS
ncbi:lipopolysaccharide heptosyltransferase I [Candidatus Halobeggiatoa sp. HSG11]|nr:lipopolysaccharide heptosyltransferase I [Candidatus Halobeggiatoa sp. HSG11]